jgi:hypothetical protein
MIEELLSLCRQKNLTEEDLDELVHEAAAQRAMPAVNEESRPKGQDQLLDAAEVSASSINNEGLEAQLKFLVQHYGEDEARRLIQELEHED